MIKLKYSTIVILYMSTFLNAQLIKISNCKQEEDIKSKIRDALLCIMAAIMIGDIKKDNLRSSMAISNLNYTCNKF